MDSAMNNTNVEQILKSCQEDLDQTLALINKHGSFDNIVPYLTKYAIIRSCGTIEMAFKTVIADFCCYRTKKQIHTFIQKQVRDNSCNPSYSNICELLKNFDENWKKDFKAKINAHDNKDKFMTSLDSLVAARNEFAHGGNPKSSIQDIIFYFQNGMQVIEILDSVITR